MVTFHLARKALLYIFPFFMMLFMTACWWTVKKEDVPGVYLAVYPFGVEKLTLKPNGEYLQEVWIWKYEDARVLRERNKWRYSNKFKDVNLDNSLDITDGYGNLEKDFHDLPHALSGLSLYRLFPWGKPKLSNDEFYSFKKIADFPEEEKHSDNSGNMNRNESGTAKKEGNARHAEGVAKRVAAGSTIDGMVLIPGGTFMMGCTEGDNGCDEDEMPPHRVTVASFYMDKTEVTVGAYREFWRKTGHDMPDQQNWYENEEEHPVGSITWSAAKAYCEWAGKHLPTEAEWEYAARGGHNDWKYPWGNEDPVCRDGARNGARYDDNRQCNDIGAAPVGSYAPNGYGLYDMAGNVWEWCADWYGEKVYYSKGSEANPEGLSLDYFRALRGGSWSNDPRRLRVSFRLSNFPDNINQNITYGFRCARTAR